MLDRFHGQALTAATPLKSHLVATSVARKNSHLKPPDMLGEHIKTAAVWLFVGPSP